jgi:RHS repeat-associated protein
LRQRLISAGYPDDTTRTFTHTDFDKPETMTTRRGETIDFTYNRAGEPAERTLPDGTGLIVARDARARITRVGRIDARRRNMVNYRYQYTPGDQVSQVRETVRGMQLDMEYACCGNLTHLLGPGELQTWFEYDDAGRMTAMGNPADGTTTFHYESHGQPVRVVHPNGVETIYTYTPRRSVESITVQRGPGDVLARWTYTYGPNQNPVTVDTLEGNHTYTYDAMNRLLTATHPGGGGENYEYDPVGNRIGSQDVPVYTYSSSHRLIEYGDVHLEYDADGNLATQTDPSGVTTYTHDSVNRLTHIDLPTGATVEYTYDGWHYRHSKTVGGETTYYLHAPHLMGEYDEAGSLIRAYIRHQQTGRVLRYHEYGETDFVHNNRLGTPHLITDAAGDVVWRATYDSFGRATVAVSSVITFNLRLPGQYYDEETGLHYNLKRYYDPEVGRFIEPDPLASADTPLWYRMVGQNEHVYASNSPLALYDPFGLCDECDDCPSGRWVGSGLGFDGMLLVVGGAHSAVSMHCEDNPVERITFGLDCLRLGAGLGIGTSGNFVRSRGCNAIEARDNLAGSGAFISGSLGPVAAALSTSTETWGVWGGGIGLGLGLELALGGEYCWIYQ